MTPRICTWRHTLKPEYLPAVPQDIQDTLDTLESLLRPTPEEHKLTFMGRLLREGRNEELLTIQEFFDLQGYLAGPRGWL